MYQWTVTKSLSDSACEKWRKKRILALVPRKGGPRDHGVFCCSGKRSRRATSTWLSAIGGSASRDCGLGECPSGHGQPLRKAGREANVCLQGVVRIVCIVLGRKDSRPLLFHLEDRQRGAKSWRQFTTEYGLTVLREADACTKPGEIGCLLR